MSNDYNNWSAGGMPCSYANLGNYTAPYGMSVAPQGKVTTGGYIVPTWSPINPDSLVGVGTCGGYADITSAYGAGAGKCNTTYNVSLCGGNMGGDCASLPPKDRKDCCDRNPSSKGCGVPMKPIVRK